MQDKERRELLLNFTNSLAEEFMMFDITSEALIKLFKSVQRALIKEIGRK